MSDLAPFVAAVLCDKTVSELQEELRVAKERVKTLEGELRVIRVTGPGGFPVYAERHFQYAKYDQGGMEMWILDFHNSTGKLANSNLPSCPVQHIEDCELHIGGREIFKIGDYGHCSSLSSIGEINCSYLYEFRDDESFPESREILLQVDFGPNPDPFEADLLDPEEYRNRGITYVRFTDFSIKKHPFKD